MNIESMTDKEFAEHIDLCLEAISPDKELSGKALAARYHSIYQIGRQTNLNNTALFDELVGRRP